MELSSSSFLSTAVTAYLNSLLFLQQHNVVVAAVIKFSPGLIIPRLYCLPKLFMQPKNLLSAIGLASDVYVVVILIDKGNCSRGWLTASSPLYAIKLGVLSLVKMRDDKN